MTTRTRPFAARPLSRALASCLLAAFAAALCPHAAHAQAPLDSTYVTDGSVFGIASTGTRTFIGGSFGRVGPLTGNVVSFAPATLESSPGYHAISHTLGASGLYCSIPDGAGGWYVGGSFTQWLGQPRGSIAHVLADGSLSPFAPVFTGAYFTGVRALALVGSRLFVAGDFSTLDGQPAPRLLAFDDDSSTPLAWDAQFDGNVQALAVSGDTLFAGGAFRTVGGERRPALAAFSTTTLAMLPGMLPGPSSGSITSLGTGDGTLRVGGSFSQVGPPTGALAVVDTVTGAALPPWLDVLGTVLAAEPDGAGGWYMGGAFGKIAGATRQNLARVGADGVVSSWNPTVSDSVFALRLVGDTLFVGGDFATVNGQSRARFAAFRASTGELLAGTPVADGRVRAIAHVEDRLFVGGEFAHWGGLPAQGLAAIERGSLAPLADQPPACGSLVTSVLAAHGRVYVAGSFTTVATPAGGVAITDTVGTLRGRSPIHDGATQAVLPDGAGGWFLGGNFTRAGGAVRRGLVHVFANGVVDTAWNAQLLTGAGVTRLVLRGGTLYAAGYALRTTGAGTLSVAAFDAATGTLLAWPGAVTNGSVHALEVSGDTVFFGGVFTTVNGATRIGLASVLVSTGALTTWGPSIQYASGSANVFGLERVGDKILVAGAFDKISAVTRVNFAVVDMFTGALDPLQISVSTPGTVYAMVTDGVNVYLGGNFTFVNGHARKNLAAVSLATGAPLAYNPAPNLPVQALWLSDDRLSVGGQFTTFNGAAAANAARILTSNGVVLPFAPPTTGNITAIACSDSAVVLGGAFNTIGSIPRNWLFAFDPGNGALSSFHANLAGGSVVRALAATQDLLYVGGTFLTVNGVTRVRLAAVGTNGIATSWTPNPAVSVYSIAVHGSRVYVGGEKQQAGYVGAWSRTTGAASAWNCAPAGIVRLVRGGDALLVGGSLAGVGGALRTNACAIDLATGTTLGWAPRFDAGPRRWLRHGGRWYAGGAFTAVNDTMRYGIVAFDEGSGALLTWTAGLNAAVNGFGFVHDTLVAGGAFTLAHGATHRYFVRLSESTGLPLGDERSPNGVVGSLAVADGRVLMTGPFSSFPMEPRAGLAALDEHGRLLPWRADVTGQPLALAIAGGQLFAAGNFWRFDAPARDMAACFDTATAAVGPWAPQPDGTVYALVVSGDKAYLGGVFSNAGGLARRNLVETDLATGAATAWNPNPNNVVYALARADGPLYAGGLFTSIGGQSRNRLAALDAAGLATAWNPNASARVNALAVGDGAIWVGGQFTTIGGQSRRLLAALSPTTGLATAWDAGFVAGSSSVDVLSARNGLLFVGGVFSSLANGAHSRTNFAVLDAGSALPTSFMPQPNGGVTTLAHAHGTLYLGGYFGIAGGQPRGGLAAFVDPSWNLELLDAPLAGGHGPLRLAAAAPNPLRGRGVLRFTLPATGRTRVALFDLAGREVAVLLDEPALAAGHHELALDASRLPAGVFWCRLVWNDQARASRMVTTR